MPPSLCFNQISMVEFARARFNWRVSKFNEILYCFIVTLHGLSFKALQNQNARRVSVIRQCNIVNTVMLFPVKIGYHSGMSLLCHSCKCPIPNYTQMSLENPIIYSVLLFCNNNNNLILCACMHHFMDRWAWNTAESFL